MNSHLLVQIHHFLDNQNFDGARSLINKAFESIPLERASESLFIQAQLYGLLIDIGCESQNESDLRIAINFFELNEKQLQGQVDKSSYYYNLANAKHGLCKIFYDKNRGVHPIPLIKEKFQEPIKLYWLAYKSISNEKEQLLEQILINLSSSLVTVGRIVEGLQFLDIVLRNNPNYPQALITRGDNLQYLSQVTNGGLTTSLYVQIYNSYNQGILTNTLPQFHLQRCLTHRQDALKQIELHGFSIDEVAKEIDETKKEYKNHTPFRKFCIDNFLTLNEHGIYCKCVAVEKDDLQIGVKHGSFKGKIIPKLELLLNRIKSEFAFARWMYYQSVITKDPFDYDAKFSELLDGEIINSQTEMQRTSFRICYGILDKIALGICKLYNLDSKRIHFENFWEDPKRKAITEIKNFHLNAIYSIACDLNTTSGELKHFKNWRNKLEHSMLVLKDTSKSKLDILDLFSDEEFIAIADLTDFQEKTRHLLQLTRAAIFSYVFCVRLQTIQDEEQSLENHSFTVKFKQ